MDVAGSDSQFVAVAVKVKGDVTLAPLRGAMTDIPEVSFAVTDGGGMEHPVTANAVRRLARASKVRAFERAEGAFCFVAGS